MSSTTRLLVGWLAVGSAALFPAQTPRWRVQYFYDQNKSSFAITDLAFASAARGVAVGQIVEGKKHKPVAVVTADGGEHWQTIEVEEPPVSLFFLKENLGWMVTTKGIWQTTEAGKNWRKLPGSPSGLLRVYFTDENNGYAAGTKKRALETHDGGLHWQAVAAAAETPGEQKYSAYNWIAFATPKAGMISGWNMPPQSYEELFPEWMDPEAAVNRRETPHLSYQLLTNDGGKTWTPKAASLLGDVTRFRFAADGRGLGLMEHSNGFRYPSEVYRVDWTTGKSETIYRSRKFAITDIWLDPDGAAWLAGINVLGQVRNIVPGKVQVLRSRGKDMTVWSATDVDYRAVANRVILAGAGGELWMATDSGMILKLTRP